MKKLFSFCVALAVVVSCQKQSTLNPEARKNPSLETNKALANNLLKNSTYAATTDTLAQRLMNDFGLVILSSSQTTGMQFNTYTNYNDAAA